jgi:PST family polysaccharide transporter
VKSTNSLLRYGGFAFSVGGARVVGILITSLTFPYLVRHLGVEMYGLWSYVLAVCAFLGIIADPGLTTYAIQQVAARREDGFELIPDVLVLRVFSSLIALVILLAIAFVEVRPDVRYLLRLYGIGLLFVSLLSADRFLSAVEMFHARSLLIVTQQAIYALGIFALVHVPKDVVWLPVCILGSSALTGLVGWTLMWRRGFKLRRAIRPQRWRGILVPSVYYGFSSFMSTLYHRTGYLAVRWFLGDHALGLYAAAARFVDLLEQFVTMVLYVLMPRMALAAKSGAVPNRLSRFAVAVMALISIPLTAGLITTAHLLVPWILGATYLQDISLLKWMSPYLLTAPAASLLAGTILYAMGRHRSYLISTAGGAVAGVLLYLTLIPAFGLPGAALAFVLAQFFVAAIAYALLPRELWGLWKNPMIGIALAGTMLMVVAVRFANAYVSSIAVVVSVGVLVYTVSCGWFVRKWLRQELGSLQ